MRPLSAPKPCAVCSSPVRDVVDAHSQEQLIIDAAQVGADVGNVVVITISAPAGLWLVEVYDQPGPPPPPTRWELNVPPALWSVHVCSSVPVTWPQLAAVAEAEAEALPA